MCVWEFCSPDLDFPRAIVAGHWARSCVPPVCGTEQKRQKSPLASESLLFRPISHPFPFSDIIPSSSSSDLRRLISSLRLPLLFAVIPSSHFPGLTPNQSACCWHFFHTLSVPRSLVLLLQTSSGANLHSSRVPLDPRTNTPGIDCLTPTTNTTTTSPTI